MIKLVFGLPGSGKSTYLAYECRKALRRNKKNTGFRVYSNYYIDGAYTLDFDRLGKDDYSNCLVLIDEISLLCDGRDWKSFTPELKYFFTNHRHYDVDIIACSQGYESDCDKRIRNCADSLFQITRAVLGFSRVRHIIKQFGVKDGRVQEYYELAGLGKFIFRPRYYKMFDSFVRRALPTNSERPWNGSPCQNVQAANAD